MAATNRLLDPGRLPSTLWNSELTTLSIPPALEAAYLLLIQRHGLEALAASRDANDPPVGGLTRELTNKHFAQAFDGSAARTQLALLDPHNKTIRASNSLIRCFSGNQVIMADTPCGAGAATLALLANIAELRANNLLPRQPLDIILIGAEISGPAREYASELLQELRPTLLNQAITVKETFVQWDVTDSLSNTDLIKRINQAGPELVKRFLIIANFNGFLIKDKKLKIARPQIEELLRHSSGGGCYAIWIEPDMNRAINQGGLFDQIRGWLQTTARLFAREDREDDLTTPECVSVSKFKQPHSPNETARVGLAVMPIDLARFKP